MCGYMMTAFGKVAYPRVTKGMLRQKCYLLLMAAQGLWYEQGVSSGEGRLTHVDCPLGLRKRGFILFIKTAA